MLGPGHLVPGRRVSQIVTVVDQNLLPGLYKVKAGDAPYQAKPWVEEDVCLAVRLEAVAHLGESLRVLTVTLTEYLVAQCGAVGLQTGHAVW